MINVMLKKVVQKLGYHPIAQVKFPDAVKMRKCLDMVQKRELLVDDIIGFMDSVSFLAECTDKLVKQNAYYCGYDYNMMMNNEFAYGSDGKFFCCNHLSRELGGG